jgi:hypothetical protein
MFITADGMCLRRPPAYPRRSLGGLPAERDWLLGALASRPFPPAIFDVWRRRRRCRRSLATAGAAAVSRPFAGPGRRWHGCRPGVPAGREGAFVGYRRLFAGIAPFPYPNLCWIMQVAASWAAPEERGTAVGLLIGCLSVGTGLPHLVTVFTRDLDLVVGVTGAMTLAGAFVALLAVKPGPYARPAVRFRLGHLEQLFRCPSFLLATAAYYGHNSALRGTHMS